MSTATPTANDSPHGVDVDVAIIGAGISGINTAYHIQKSAPKGTTYAILEARDTIGGTWDLFRYPGIRSDSDIYTFGFSWNPWTKEKTLASGAEIVTYMQQSTAKYGIDKNIRFHHKVLSADWSSKRSLWVLRVQVDETTTKVLHARYIVLGTGYYDYNEPLKAVIPGIENFKGSVIHPQFWPKDFDYTNKNVVVIGSGATAVTLVPSMATTAKHVTMLQRSPTYVAALHMHSKEAKFLRPFLPSALSAPLMRLIFAVRSYLTFYYCILFPDSSRRAIRKATIEQLPSTMSWDPHFNPRYNPWEQRFCVCPDGDFFTALRSGLASVVTDTIATVTESEIHLASGETLKPDIIVTATGLKLHFAGGIKLSVDGNVVDPSSKFIWKGLMMQDVPNMAFVFGYANASWTLGAEVAAVVLTRLLGLMHRKDVKVAVPRIQNQENMKETRLLSLSSTYVKDLDKVFPKGGEGQWSLRRNYFVDMYRAQWGDISTGLEFSREVKL